jgi:hypothetical protein
MWQRRLAAGTDWKSVRTGLAEAGSIRLVVCAAGGRPDRSSGPPVGTTGVRTDCKSMLRNWPNSGQRRFRRLNVLDKRRGRRFHIPSLVSDFRLPVSLVDDVAEVSVGALAPVGDVDGLSVPDGDERPDVLGVVVRGPLEVVVAVGEPVVVDPVDHGGDVVVAGREIAEGEVAVVVGADLAEILGFAGIGGDEVAAVEGDPLDEFSGVGVGGEEGDVDAVADVHGFIFHLDVGVSGDDAGAFGAGPFEVGFVEGGLPGGFAGGEEERCGGEEEEG